MKTKNVILNRSIVGAACAGAVMLMTSGASAQNLLVANYTTGDIYEYTPGGTQSTFASGMANPVGLAFNSTGDLFVGNSANNGGGEFGNITEITPGGTQSTFASGIDPQAIAFNAAGDLFEADYDSGNIYEFAPNGTRTTFASGFNFPISITFNSTGNLFVGSGYGNGNGVITQITPGGTQTTFASGLNFPQALAFNNMGNLFEADNGSGVVNEFTPGGTQSTFTSINDPSKLAFNSAGDLFVSSGLGAIYEVAPGGTQTTFATASGSLSGLAFAPVPEPSVMALAGLGAVGLIFRRRKN